MKLDQETNRNTIAKQSKATNNKVEKKLNSKTGNKVKGKLTVKTGKQYPDRQQAAVTNGSAATVRHPDATNPGTGPEGVDISKLLTNAITPGAPAVADLSGSGHNFILPESITQLEPRLLLAADAADSFLAGEDDAGDDAGMEAVAMADPVAPSATKQPVKAKDILASIRNSDSIDYPQGLQVVLIDMRVLNYRDLADQLKDQATILFVDGTQDLVAIVEQLAAAAPEAIASLHLISHGASGKLLLGADELDFSDLSAEQQQGLISLGQLLTSDADIFLYGCNFARGETGAAAAQLLAKLTEADVSASDDITGKGGDGKLELQVGTIEGDQLLTEAMINQFDEALIVEENGEYDEGQPITEAGVNTYFDTNGNHYESGSRTTVARTGGTVSAGEAPEFRGGEILDNANNDIATLLTKRSFNLDDEKVIIVFQGLTSSPPGIANPRFSVFSLAVLDGNADFSNIFVSGHAQSLGQIANYVGGDQTINGRLITAAELRNRHLASFSNYFAQSLQYSDTGTGNGAYMPLAPPSSTGHNLLVVRGRTTYSGEGINHEGSYNNYINQHGTEMPRVDSAYSNNVPQSLVRAIFYRDGDNYYMQIQVANTANPDPENDNHWQDAVTSFTSGNEAVNSRSSRDIYNGGRGIQLNVDGVTGFENIKFLLTFGNTENTVASTIRYLGVFTDPANDSPEFVANSTFEQAGAPIDTTGMAAAAAADGIAIADLLTTKFTDSDSNDVGIAITGFGSGYDASKHRVQIGRADANGVIQWQDLSNASFSGGNFQLLRSTDRILITSSDGSDDGQSQDNIVNFRLWDGFLYTGMDEVTPDARQTDNTNQVATFSTNGGNVANMPGLSSIGANFVAIGTDPVLQQTDIVDSNGAVVTAPVVNISHLGASTNGNYNLLLQLTFDQAVRLNATATSISLTVPPGQTALTGSFIAQTGFQRTWQYAITIPEDYEGSLDFMINDLQLFETAGGQRLANLPAATTIVVDVKPPDVSLSESARTVAENNPLGTIRIVANEPGLSHAILPDPTTIDHSQFFSITNLNLDSIGDLDFEALFPNAVAGTGSGETEIKIVTTDDAGNTTTNTFTLTVNNEVENTSPTQTAAGVVTLQEDEVNGQRIDFDDLNLQDSNERGQVSDDASAFTSISIIALPPNGRIVLRNGGTDTEQAPGSTIMITDIVAGRLFYIPDQNYSNTTATPDVLSFRATDSDGTTSPIGSPFILNFEVTERNDTPTTSGSDTINVSVNDTLTFAASNFVGLYNDPEDGDTPSAIFIRQITKNGSPGDLLLAGITLPDNADTRVNDLNELTFVSTSGASGNLVFTFYGIDSDGSQDATQLGTITLAITMDQNLPTGGDVTVMGQEDDLFETFPDVGSSYNFTDLDTNDVFAGIVVTSLPLNTRNTSSGTLSINGVAVTVGQRLSTADLAALIYQPADNYNGRVTFRFRVVNNRDASSAAEYDFNIDLADQPDPVMTGPATITLMESPSGMDDYTFSPADFEYSDLDDPNENMMQLAFDTLPASTEGEILIRINGNFTTYTAGNAITVAQLRAGDLIIRLRQNYSGTINLSYRVWNAGPGTGNSPAAQDFFIEVTNVANVPTSADKTVTIAEDINGGYVFNQDPNNRGDTQQNDFVFNDPDPGDEFAGVIITSLPQTVHGRLVLTSATGGNPVDIRLNNNNRIALADLGRLRFIPAANLNNNNADSTQVFFRFSVYNNNNQNSSVHTIAFDITPVNDPITARDSTIQHPQLVEDGTAYVFTPDNFDYNDPDDPNKRDMTFTLGLIPDQAADGLLRNDQQPLQRGDSFTWTDIQAGRISFTPAADRSGAVTFTGRFSNSGGPAGADVTITLQIAGGADAPESRDKSIDIREGTTHTFLSHFPDLFDEMNNDFAFRDPDAGDTFSQLRITSIPNSATQGSLFLNGNEIRSASTANPQNIAANDIANLEFRPFDENFFGTVTFNFLVTNNNNEVSTIHTFTIVVNNIDDPPQGISRVVIDTAEGVALQHGVMGFDFNLAYSDTEGDRLASIVFTNGFPDASVGRFEINMIPVTMNAVTGEAVIAVADLARLRFVPDPDYKGNTSLEFQFEDANGVRSALQTLDILVANTDDAPESRDNTVTIPEDGTYTFVADTNDRFSARNSFAFQDDEGEIFNSVIIASLPPISEGQLLLNGNAITAAGFRLVAAQIPNLQFRPAENWSGTSTFRFRVTDTGMDRMGNLLGAQPESTNYTFTIMVDALDDPPELTANSDPLTINTRDGQTIAYGTRANNINFVFNYQDDDGDALEYILLERFPSANVGMFAIRNQAGVMEEILPTTVGTGGTEARILASQLPNLFFVAGSGPANNVTIRYSFVNANGESVQYDMTFNIGQVDDPPTLANHLSISIDEGGQVNFDEFRQGLLNDYNDDENIPLSGIRIVSLPNSNVGIIFKGDNTELAVGDRLTLAEIAALRFDYAAGYDPGNNPNTIATISLTFVIYNEDPNRPLVNGVRPDEIQESIDTYSFSILITPQDDPPIADNLTITVAEEQVASYGSMPSANSDRFAFSFQDDDNTTTWNLIIASIPDPDQGSLYIARANNREDVITAGRNIPSTDLGGLRFRGAEDFFGTFTVTFAVSSDNLRSSSYDLVIVVTSTPDRPKTDSGTVTVSENDDPGNSNGTFTFAYNAVNPSLSDFEFTDPEGAELLELLISDPNQVAMGGELFLNGVALTGTNIAISRQDLQAGGLTFVANRYYDQPLEFGFRVVADRTGGLSESAEQTMTIEITGVPNDPEDRRAPTATRPNQMTFTIDEDEGRDIEWSDFDIFDPDAGDTVTYLVITNLPNANVGKLTYDGQDVVASQTIMVNAAGTAFEQQLRFIPADNYNTHNRAADPTQDPTQVNPPASIAYRVFTHDGDAQNAAGTNENNISFTILAEDDPIQADSITKTITEDQTVTFERNDFLGPNGQPNDPDTGEDLATVVFDRVPSPAIGQFVVREYTNAAGALVAERILTDNAMVEREGLEHLEFRTVPHYDQNITTSFTIVSTSGVNAIRFFPLVIEITPDADDPELAGEAPTLTVEADMVTNISIDNFEDAFSDPDEGSSFNGIVIKSIPDPTFGELKIGNSPDALTVGRTLSLADLANLIFDPNGRDGDGSFRFSLLDEDDNESSPILFTIVVERDQNLPESIGRSGYVSANRIFAFEEQHIPYLDRDGDEFVSVRFLAQPDPRGVLYSIDPNDPTVETEIRPGQVIARADIINLRFRLEQDFSSGLVEVVYQVINDRGAESNPATFTLVISDPINQPPQALAVEPDQPLPFLNDMSQIEINRQFTYNLLADLANHFSDPDGDPLTVKEIIGLDAAGLNFDPVSGIISGVPSDEEAGLHRLKVVVEDPFGEVAEKEFQVIVADLYLRLKGGTEEVSFVVNTDLIKQLDSNSIIPSREIADRILLLENLKDSVSFGPDRDLEVRSSLALSVPVDLTPITVTINEGESLAILRLQTNWRETGYGRVFVLVIQLDQPAGYVPPEAGSPGAAPIAPDFIDTPSPTQRYLQSAGSAGSVNPSDPALPPSGGLNPSGRSQGFTTRNTQGYLPELDAQSAVLATSLPADTRPLQRLPATEQLAPVSTSGRGFLNIAPLYLDKFPKVTPPPGALTARVNSNAEQLDQFNTYLASIVRPYNQEAASFRPIVESTAQFREFGFSSTSPSGEFRNAFFQRGSKNPYNLRPIDRVVTAALREVAGDPGSQALPSGYGSGSDLQRILQSGHLPIRPTLATLFNFGGGNLPFRSLPSDGQQAAVPPAPVANLPQAPQPAVQQPVTPPATVQPPVAPLGNIQQAVPEAPAVTPGNEREDILVRLLELLRNQDSSTQASGAQAPPVTADPSVNQERFSERRLDLLNNLVRGR